jgi:broad specificity phosphatase PhoE
MEADLTLAKRVRGFGSVVALLAIALPVSACTAQLLPEVSPVASATPAATSTPVLFTPTASPMPSSTPATAASLWGTKLVEALLQGGYVIYFRHAATDQSETDASPLNLKSCRKQRNLNDQGRADARAIGLAFLALDIPIGRVLSSEYCRTRDTAMLAFGQAEISSDLTGFPEDLREQRIAALREVLSTRPESGTNTVLVAHGFNITNTAGITLAEGEAAIFMPSDADGFTLLARVLPAEWAELERMAAGPVQVTSCATEGQGAVSSAECLPDPRLLADPGLLLPDLQSLPPTNLRIRTRRSKRR